MRHAPGDVAVNVVSMKVSGVEADADPVAARGLDDFEQATGLGHDTAVVLDAQKDAMFPGVFTDLLERLDAKRLGLLQ